MMRSSSFGTPPVGGNGKRVLVMAVVMLSFNQNPGGRRWPFSSSGDIHYSELSIHRIDEDHLIESTEDKSRKFEKLRYRQSQCLD